MEIQPEKLESTPLSAAILKLFDDHDPRDPACETKFQLDINQFCFKGFLAEYTALAAQLTPYTAPRVQQLASPAKQPYCNQELT
jgi:hypothetical protein